MGYETGKCKTNLEEPSGRKIKYFLWIPASWKNVTIRNE